MGQTCCNSDVKSSIDGNNLIEQRSHRQRAESVSTDKSDEEKNDKGGQGVKSTAIKIEEADDVTTSTDKGNKSDTESVELTLTDDEDHSHLLSPGGDNPAPLGRQRTPEPSYSSEALEQAKKGFVDAINSGNDSLAMSFVQEFPKLDLLHTTFANGDNCLHIAVRNKEYKLIVYLLDSGLSPNACNEMNGETPLHTAVQTGEVNTVALLMKNSAEPEIKNNNGETPLEIAKKNGNEALVELLEHATQKLLGSDLRDDQKQSGTNKFGHLRRSVTKKALSEMARIHGQEDELPQLAAWVDKKQAAMPHAWQKRWVAVCGSYILWSDIQREITDSKSMKERKKWNNSVNLQSISEVKAITKGKTQRKWTMVVGDGKKKREYHWRCANEKERTIWVEGLKEHIAHKNSVVTYLGTK